MLSAQGSYNELAGDMTPGVSFLGSDRCLNVKLGVLVSASYDERHLIEEGADTRWTFGGSNGGWNAASTVPGPVTGNQPSKLNYVVAGYGADAGRGIYAPRVPSYASCDTSSRRLGLTIAMQFRPIASTLNTVQTSNGPTSMTSGR